MSRPVVYLIAEPSVKRDGKTPDLSPLGDFGEVQVCLPSGFYPALHPSKALDMLYKKLDNFDPALDFIAWAGGDTLAVLLLGVVLADFEAKEINWLRYQRGWKHNGKRVTMETGSYRNVKVKLDA